MVLYFSSLDVKAGYWQVMMDAPSRKYTAFSTPDGHFEFNRMPFGLKNSPALFVRLMNGVLRGLTNTECYFIIHLANETNHLKHFS